MRVLSKRRREQRLYAATVGTLTAIAAWACLAVAAFGGITVPDKVEPHTPIVAAVSIEGVPEGAKLRGGFTSTTAKIEPGPQANVWHVWAAPGKHTLIASGVWVVTRDVTVGTETFPVLVDFGQYGYTAVVTVAGGGPDPKPDPTPGGKYQLVLFYQADQLDNYPQAQRSLLTSLALREKLKTLGHQFLQVVEEAQIPNTASGLLADFGKSVAGDPLPRLAIRPVSGGPVTDFPLPADEVGLMKLLEVK